MAEKAPDLPDVDFNDIFSLRKPKDFKAGVSSGLKSAAKGVFGGVAGLVTLPIIGASDSGVKGFAKGIASGVVAAVVLPVTGVAIGLAQVTRGAVNQPEALIESSKGKQWDPDNRVWLDHLDGALVLSNDGPGQRRKARGGLLKKTAGVGGGSTSDDPADSDDDYYTILQVPRDATSDLIKKQYYILARRFHPDKNPGNAEAHERFQKLGEAYQILSNHDLRQRYDKYGSEALDMNFMDNDAFFGMLFGSDQFEPLVGTLLIAELMGGHGGEMSSLEMQRNELNRVEMLAKYLGAHLKRYVHDESGFRIMVEGMAKKLVNASFGETMLHVIGESYVMQAKIKLGGFFGGIIPRMKLSTNSLKSQVNVANAALKVFKIHQEMQRVEEAVDRQEALKASQRMKDVGAQSSGGKGGEGRGEREGSKKDSAGNNPSRSDSYRKNKSASAASSSASDDDDDNGDDKNIDNDRDNDDKDTFNGPNYQANPSYQANSNGLGRATATNKPSTASSIGFTAPLGASGVNPTTAAAAAAAAKEYDALLHERKKLEDSTAKLMLDAMWAANVIDIQNIIEKVCKRVLNNRDLPKADQMSYARALLILGETFMATKNTEEASKADVSAEEKMQEAMMKVVEKRMHQEEVNASKGEGRLGREGNE